MNPILILFFLHVTAALCALFLPGRAARPVVAVLTAAAALTGAGLGAWILQNQSDASFSLTSSLPFMTWLFHADGLSAFFLLLIALVAVPVCIYGVGYTRENDPRHYNRVLGVFLPVFLLSMNLVVLAGNVFTFLFCWEIMALSSYFLVISENDSRENLTTGRWYAGMSHAGFAMIAASLLLLAVGAGGNDFQSIRLAAASIAPATRNAIFLVALVGFGSKAGLIPLHVWLPKAHPAAPSHVSALMSGVMIKMGVYGVLRVVLDLLGGGPSWWGGLVLALGAASAFLGVLYALMEHDLKRLLAYHTVENAGIIFIGIGLGFVFQSYRLETLATLAVVAGLYHTMNHASFKGLLFLGAGSILKAAGTRNMEEMGGLIKKMPYTAACFLVGSAAISALPPLNGFVSEWMVFQSLIAGVQVPHAFMAAMMAVTVGVLALTGGLAAACFVKAFGISFLAMPRSERAGQANEVCWSMRIGMLILAAACVLLGVLPFAVTPRLSASLRGMPGLDRASPGFHLGLALEMPGHFALISPTFLAICLLIVLGAIPVALLLTRSSRALRRGETWGCGRIAQTARMEYTSTAFAEPLRRVFADLYQPTKDVTIDFHPDSKYFVHSIEYRSHVRAWFEDYLYQPLFTAVRFVGMGGKWIQSGSIHGYLTYIFVALLALLLMARWIG